MVETGGQGGDAGEGGGRREGAEVQAQVRGRREGVDVDCRFRHGGVGAGGKPLASYHGFMIFGGWCMGRHSQVDSVSCNSGLSSNGWNELDVEPDLVRRTGAARFV